MTGRENLEFVARLFGHRRRDARRHAQDVLERLGLGDAGDRLVRTYSGGMRRRLDLGASLVGAPKLLLLDEPTTGLDPRSRRELWDCVTELVAHGTDVLLTTQYLEEADRLASHVAIVDRGRVVAEGSPDALKARAGKDVLEVGLTSESDLAEARAALERIAAGPVQYDCSTRTLTVPVEGVSPLVGAVQALGHLDHSIDHVVLRRPTLDEVFLALTDAAADGAPSAAPGEDGDGCGDGGAGGAPTSTDPQRLRPAA